MEADGCGCSGSWLGSGEVGIGVDVREALSLDTSRKVQVFLYHLQYVLTSFMAEE